MTEQKGLILINTGTGKGKTTAALGTAIRAWGNGQKVLILQFIKGAWKYGELKAIEAVVDEVMSDRWDLVVLDEVNYAIHFEMLEPEKLLKLIKERPPRLNMILTGRYARPEIIEAADTVTEMTLIKHAFQNGIHARKGIEF